MHILHVISGLRQSAGTSTFLCEVCNRLHGKGHCVTVAVRSPSASRTTALSPDVRVVGLYDLVKTNGLWKKIDIVHIHALWNPMQSMVAMMSRCRRVPVVWSTHGMTAPWAMAHKRFKKWIPWYLYQRRALSSAALIHATTVQEADWNRGLGFDNRQIVVPLGTDLPSERVVRIRRAADPLLVLFVGRIYPVKGLMNVVRAASELRDVPIRFRIVGPDEANHQSELITEALHTGVASMFEWPGAKYGDELSAEYDACDLVMLPSFTENFGATVVDALAHCKPALTSCFTPWQVLQERKCGWWVPNDPRSLAEAFRMIASLAPDEMNMMGLRGRRLVEEHYTWGAVCNAMINGYDMLLTQGQPC